MLIPYNTDAPIYHFPYATIGVIAANVVIYFATASLAASAPSVEDGVEAESASVFSLASSEITDWLALQYDQINPVQWITSNFMHGDVLHLIGNMIFLWGFGLIIEGKLGWLRFLFVYLVIGVVTCAVEQLIMFALNIPGASLGASAVIYGLMAIAMLWAPLNEMSCLLFLRLTPRLVDIKVIWFASIYFALQVVYFAIGGFEISSAALHLGGFLAGLPLGYIYLKRRWVDCEGWDAMTVYFASPEEQDRKRSEFRDRNKVAAVREAKEQRDQEVTQMVESITSALRAKQGPAAVAIYRKFESDLHRGKKLPPKLLPALISALHSQKQWEPSIPLLVLALQKFPADKTTRLRLTLAQILIQFTDQPKQAIAVLRKLPKQLSDKETSLRLKLAKKAKAAITEGTFEVDVHDW